MLKKQIIQIKKLLYKNNGKINHNNIWVFGEWFGQRCCDNALYLANYLAENCDEIKLFWIADAQCDLSLLNKRINVLNMDSAASLETLNKADVIVTIQGLYDITNNLSYIPKHSLVVNLWHGVPWKKIYFDAVDENIFIHKIKSIFKHKLIVYDVLLSTSEIFSNILLSAFCTNFSHIIEAGYPRNTIFYDLNKIKECRKKIAKMLNISEKTTIITYMPTYRNNNSNFNFYEIAEDNAINKVLSKHNAIIIQKSHFISKSISKGNNKKIIDIENEISAQELLAATDLLITDYSSCAFDFLLLNRPIVYFLYDYDEYMLKEKRLYFRKEEICAGDYTDNIDLLIKYIDENLSNPKKYELLRNKKKNLYLKYESSDSCEIIYNEIIKKLCIVNRCK